MELLQSARIVWRRRALTGVALAVGIIVGLLVSFKPTLSPLGLKARTHTVGEATAQVLIDTQRSQISDLNPAGGANLYSRATLLADVLATAPSQTQLAASLKIDPRALEVTPPAGSGLAPIRPTSLATAGAAAATVTPSWSLTITQDPTLPLIGLSTQAPTTAGAAALANHAIAILKQQVQKAAQGQQIPATGRVVINTISPPVTQTAVAGIRKAYGLVAAVVVFLIGCFLIVLWDRFAPERWRAEKHRLRHLGEAIEDLAVAVNPGTHGRPNPETAMSGVASGSGAPGSESSGPQAETAEAARAASSKG